MHTPTLQRIRRRMPPSRAVTTQLPGGAVSLDLGPDMFDLLLRQMLKERGLRSRV